MKTTLLFLIVVTMQINAATFAQQLTLRQKNVPISKVFDEIKKQTGYDVFYLPSTLDTDRKINANFNATALQEVMEICLQDQQAVFTIDEETIVIRRKPETGPNTKTTAEQQLPVSGRVSNEKGAPLVGASVYVLDNKGERTRIRTITNWDGIFVLPNVSELVTLEIVYLGYATRRVSAKMPIGNIQLKVSSSSVEEVEVLFNTGYQTLSRERSAGSFAKPDMTVLAERSGTNDIIQRLDGLIPGLVINNSSSPTNGPVGNSSSGNSIIIRGLSTLNANRQPLIVLNGVPIDDVSAINPNDVEDITVLKDATAASIWGAKATNGVIVITTKKGRIRETMKVNYDGFVNFQGKPQIEKLNTLDSRAFIQAAKDVFDPVLNNYQSISTPQSGGVAPIMPHETILYNLANLPQSEVDAQLEKLAGQDGVAQMKDLLYRNALLTNHTLAVSGGSDRYSYYGSGSYVDTKNSKPGDKNQNYGLNLRQDYTFNRWLKIHLITDFVNNAISSLNTIQPTSAFLPYVLFQNSDGSHADLSWLYRDGQTRNNYESLSGIGLHYIPLDEINTGGSTGNTFTGKVNSGVTVNLFSGLRYEGVFSISKGQTRSINDLYQDNYAVRSELVSFTPLDGSEPYLPETGGRRTVTYSNHKNWTVRNQFIYDQAWDNGKHNLILLGGQEAQEQLYTSNRSVVRGYNSQLLTTGYIDYSSLSLGVGNVVMPTGVGGTSRLTPDFYSETENLVRITSYYSNAGYMFNNKYTLNAATRIDQSNLFGKDKSAQNKPLWSIGAAWQIGKERFVENLNWLDQLALRTSYGLTGNSPNPGTAASQDILETLYIGNAAVYPEGSGLILSMPANRKLTWETTKTLNIGVDFALLGNRLNGTLDFYDKRTENLIAPMLVNPLTGYSNITGNAGNLTNKGIDLNLDAVIIAHNNFRWSTFLNLGYNRNKLTKINRETPLVRGDQLISNPYVEGYSAFAVFAYPYAGLDNVGDPQIELQDGTVTKARNVTSVDDMKYMGTFQPIWSGGFGNTLTYHNFSLRVNAIYNLGHVMRRDVNTLYGGRGLVANSGYFATFTGNINSEFSDRWRKPGDEEFTDIPAYSTAAVSTDRGNMGYYMNADRNVLNASYIKIRDITLSYKLPRQWTDRVRADGITFRAQVSNIMLWKANSQDIDPEFMDAYGGWDGSANILGIYQGGYRKVPTNQGTVTFGANISF